MAVHSNIKDLRGESLSAVSFVRDYVEFHFDGPVLRALTPPLLTSEKGEWRFPGPGSRDGLCGLIGDRVSSVEVDDEARICLLFDSGRVLTVPLDSPTSTSPEAAHFVSEVDRVMHVW